ncbi:MAG: hexokinase [Spirochaetaceae bacterium]|nr:hexokinase [Spirochaetaceae bacterium]
MKTHEKVTAFLGKHGFLPSSYNINSVIDGLLYDMKKGLSAENSGGKNMAASQDMIPTWGMPPAESPKNKSVIVIDAGGTNFRSCIVSFDENGTASISELEKTSMPGIERELSKKDFFDAIAKNLDHLKNKENKIGFCFSYAMKITPDSDGQVIAFSKEIKAKEVEGSLVGASLADALVARGWNRPEKITLLNDTTAALLAGASNATQGRAYSSYVGFILGTGMNSAYIDSDPIEKISGIKDSKGRTAPKSQIVVCESGKFDKLPRSEFDLEFDKTTNTPGLYVMEKMCSGNYLGPVAGIALKKAAEDGLFSPSVAKAVLALPKLELKDMDRFFYAPADKETVLGQIVSAGTQEDADIMYAILDAFVERSARLASAIIAAAVIKSGKGTNTALPVGIVCDGTTFYKTHNLQYRIRGYLNEVLISQRHLYFEIITVDNDITLGTAVAGLC